MFFRVHPGFLCNVFTMRWFVFAALAVPAIAAGQNLPAAGLVLDLDAAKGVGLESGDKVAAWANQVPGAAAKEFVKRDEGRKEPGSGRPVLLKQVPVFGGKPALDFRQPPDAGYPGAPADINYGIRWLKSRAAQLKGRADRVGVMGISSGGQQAMMSAFRPADPRYASLPLAAAPNVDAKVNCVILCWPVIDPLGRYEYAKGLKGTGKPGSELAERWIESHDQY